MQIRRAVFHARDGRRHKRVHIPARYAHNAVDGMGEARQRERLGEQPVDIQARKNAITVLGGAIDRIAVLVERLLFFALLVFHEEQHVAVVAHLKRAHLGRCGAHGPRAEAAFFNAGVE